MNTAELTALHTATLTAMTAESRLNHTYANITRRAQTLFNDGYTVERSRVDGLYFITSPEGQEYHVNLGTALLDSCDCPAFVKYDTCKHFQAVELMLMEAAQSEAADREAEQDEECRNFFESRYEMEYA